MPCKSHFAMLAHYNAWANGRIFEAAARLSDADYRADRGAFFGSVHGTLNHLLATDLIWMRRFTGKGDAPDRLDAIVHEDRALLLEARIAEDLRIRGWIEGLSENALAGIIRYRTMTNPDDITQPLAPALTHLFNHQTHHRGQVHCLLTGIGGRDSAPSLDLILMQRQTGIGMA